MGYTTSPVLKTGWATGPGRSGADATAASGAPAGKPAPSYVRNGRVMWVDGRDVTQLAHPVDRAAHSFGPADALDLLDWKRRIFALYAEVRAATDPEVAWSHWRDVRENLYRTHPQSPLPPEQRGSVRRRVLPLRPLVPRRRRDRRARRRLPTLQREPDSRPARAGRSRSAGSASPTSHSPGRHTSSSCTGTRPTAAASSSPSQTRPAAPRPTAAAATCSIRSREPISAAARPRRRRLQLRLQPVVRVRLAVVVPTRPAGEPPAAPARGRRAQPWLINPGTLADASLTESGRCPFSA